MAVQIFSTWEQLKTPNNDDEIVKFVEHIENDVSFLKSIDQEKELECSYQSREETASQTTARVQQRFCF